tara:strand:- start:112 stop:591 length:480 start_codon:yes stop_codon:yes gene_type:complete
MSIVNKNKRVMFDIKLLTELDIGLEVKDLKTITCFVNGPEDTIYENGRWQVIIEFPDKYPFKSPSIGFIDKIFHPNVDYRSGSICLNVLNEEWQPIYTVKHIIETFIPQLLTYPNPDDPLNVEAAHLYQHENETFIDYVKETMHKYKTLKTRKNAETNT